jgi:CyaY protein
MADSAVSAAFAARVERLLSSIDAAFDAVAEEHDVDVERSGMVMTITFESGHRVVINSQEANHEVWLAAKSGGFHYRWDDARSAWCDTRGGDDLDARLVDLVAAETGATITI